MKWNELTYIYNNTASHQRFFKSNTRLCLGSNSDPPPSPPPRKKKKNSNQKKKKKKCCRPALTTLRYKKKKIEKNDHILLIRHLMLGVNAGWQFPNTAVEHHNASDFHDPWPFLCFSLFLHKQVIYGTFRGVSSPIALHWSEQPGVFGFVVKKK